MAEHNVVSVSGGKDSTALLLLAQALEVPNMQAVFADTGHEHPQTYEYLRYLEDATGVPIRWIRADFTADIERKRKYVESKWREKGVAESVVLSALDTLRPTGVPFLDLCLMKGRFPSTRVAFCTEELKRNPIIEQVMIPLMSPENMVLSWQGVRLDESYSRRIRLQGTGACVKTVDAVGGGLFNYRPILRWNVESVFEAHRAAGIKPNPLYSQGCSRVGCMPCINSGKDELREIALRWPEEVDRVRRWEQLVSQTSKQGAATFFSAVTDPTVIATDRITHETHGIDRIVEWAQTDRGGRQFNMFTAQLDGTACSSAYGLCE